MREVCISPGQTGVKLQPGPSLCGNEAEAGLNTPYSWMMPSLSVFLSLTLCNMLTVCCLGQAWELVEGEKFRARKQLAFVGKIWKLLDHHTRKRSLRALIKILHRRESQKRGRDGWNKWDRAHIISNQNVHGKLWSLSWNKEEWLCTFFKRKITKHLKE